MNKLFHINSCVYQVLVHEDGHSEARMLQINNPILSDKVTLGYIGNMSPNELIAHWKEKDSSRRVMFAYPVIIREMDKEYNYLEVTGETEVGSFPDPSKLTAIQQGKTEEEDLEFIKKALAPKFSKEKFTLYIPITDEYAWDLTFSHVPPKSVIDMTPGVNPTSQENGIEPALSLDPMFSNNINNVSSPEDFNNAVRQIVYQQAKTHHDRGLPPEEFQPDFDELARLLNVDRDTLMKNITFKSMQDTTEE